MKEASDLARKMSKRHADLFSGVTPVVGLLGETGTDRRLAGITCPGARDSGPGDGIPTEPTWRSNTRLCSSARKHRCRRRFEAICWTSWPSWHRRAARVAQSRNQGQCRCPDCDCAESVGVSISCHSVSRAQSAIGPTCSSPQAPWNSSFHSRAARVIVASRHERRRCWIDRKCSHFACSN